MKIPSKIMALTMTALLAAAPALAQNYSSGTNNSATGSNVSGSMSNSSNVNSGSSMQNMNTGSNVKPMGMNLKNCGLTQAKLCNLSLTSLDKNGNGTISRSEFRKDKGSMKLFNKIDANHNGVISQAELNAYNEGKIGTGVNRIKRR